LVGRSVSAPPAGAAFWHYDRRSDGGGCAGTLNNKGERWRVWMGEAESCLCLPLLVKERESVPSGHWNAPADGSVLLAMLIEASMGRVNELLPKGML
jgi:hypothetical protein